MVSKVIVREFRTIQSGLIAAAFIFTAFAYSLLCAPQASALLLDHPLVTAKTTLPLGDLGNTVADLANPVTSNLQAAPVTIQSTPNIVGAAATVPALSSSPETAPSLNVNVPISDVVPAVTRAAQAPISLLSSPSSQSANPSPSDTGSSIAQNSSATDPGKSSTTQQKEQPKQPLFAKLAHLFESIPNAVQALANGIAGKNVSALPIIISLVIFVLTFGAIGGIVYASNNGGIVALGRIGSINMSKLAEAHDVAQIGTFVVVTICFGLVAIFLTLNVL